jgi:peptidoglycan/LPS O-acetylase OafA/YrhL
VIFSLNLKRAMIACLACIVLSVALRLTLLSMGIGNPVTAVLTPCRLDALALGAWLALARRRGWFTPRFARWAGIAFSICLFLLIGAFTRSGFKVEAEDLATQSVGYTVIAVMFGALIVLALGQGWFSFLNTPFFRLCGKYSYMMYIIHLPLHGILYKIFQTQQITARLPSPILRLLPFNLFATLACIGIAAVTWRLYESQFLKLKKRFSS